MTATIDLKSIKWRSRRGMLELDLMLQPFIEKSFDTLDSEQSILYWELLEEEDQSLWRWLLEIEPCPDKYKSLISIIRNK